MPGERTRFACGRWRLAIANFSESLFRRDAKTNTRDACATQSACQPSTAAQTAPANEDQDNTLAIHRACPSPIPASSLRQRPRLATAENLGLRRRRVELETFGDL